MGTTYDRIDRALSREIDAIENSDMDPREQAKEIRELERGARWQYQEEMARQRDEEDRW